MGKRKDFVNIPASKKTSNGPGNEAWDIHFVQAHKFQHTQSYLRCSYRIKGSQGLIQDGLLNNSNLLDVRAESGPKIGDESGLGWVLSLSNYVYFLNYTCQLQVHTLFNSLFSSITSYCLLWHESNDISQEIHLHLIFLFMV